MWNGISKDRISCTKSQEKTETGVFKRNKSKKLRKNWSKGELNWLGRKKSGEQISDPFVCNMFSVMDFSSFSIHLLHIILIIYFSYVKYNHIWLLIIENFFFPFTNSALVTAISAPSQAQSYSLPITVFLFLSDKEISARDSIPNEASTAKSTDIVNSVLTNKDLANQYTAITNKHTILWSTKQVPRQLLWIIY